MQNRKTPTLALILALGVLAAGAAAAQTDEEAIRQLIADNIAAYVSGDVDGLVAMYTEDVHQLPPFAPARNGIEAARASSEEGQSRASYTSDTSVTSVTVVGARAWAHARFDDTTTPKDGSATVRAIGNWILLLRRTDDGWKVYREIWNYEHAPGQAPTS